MQDLTGFLKTLTADSASTLRMEVLTSFPQGQEWAEKWNDLKEQMADADAFGLYEYVQTAAAFDSSGRPVIFCGYLHDGFAERLVGIAPLMLRERIVAGFRRIGLEFITGPWGDCNDLIAAPGQLQLFVQEVTGLIARMIEQKVISHVCLNNLPDDSPALQQLTDSFCRRGLIVTSHQSDTGMALELADTDMTELRQLLRKDHVRRKLRALQKKGRTEFQVVRDPAEIQSLLKWFYQIHTVRYLLDGRASIYDPQVADGFHRMIDRLAGSLNGAGRFCMPTLFFQERPVALAFCFDYQQVINLYGLTFDPGLVGTSPGEILILELTNYCQTHNKKRLDFGAGDEGYKARFTNHQRQMLRLMVHNGTAIYSSWAIIQHARAWAKQHPSLWHNLRQLKSWLQVPALESRRVGRARAIANWLQHIVSVSLQQDSLSEMALPQTSDDLRELRTDELVEVVMKYRADLPAWEFQRAMKTLRQKQHCGLEIRDGHLRGIIPLPQALRTMNATAEPDNMPACPGRQFTETVPPKVLGANIGSR